MNPYASQLDGQDPLAILSSTADRIEEIFAPLGDVSVNQPLAPGKWSPREIVIHLADCEIAHSFRYRQALAEDNPIVQPWDQEKWAKYYAAYDAQQALRAFMALRQWNVALPRSLNAEQMARPVNHPERGDLTVRELAETAAGHDINHLKQLEATLKQAA